MEHNISLPFVKIPPRFCQFLNNARNIQQHLNLGLKVTVEIEGEGLGGMFVICVKYFYYRDYIVGETQNNESVFPIVAIPVGSYAKNSI